MSTSAAAAVGRASVRSHQRAGNAVQPDRGIGALDELLVGDVEDLLLVLGTGQPAAAWRAEVAGRISLPSGSP
jgi:hypothetical protein